MGPPCEGPASDREAEGGWCHRACLQPLLGWTATAGVGGGTKRAHRLRRRGQPQSGTAPPVGASWVPAAAAAGTSARPPRQTPLGQAVDLGGATGSRPAVDGRRQGVHASRRRVPSQGTTKAFRSKPRQGCFFLFVPTVLPHLPPPKVPRKADGPFSMGMGRRRGAQATPLPPPALPPPSRPVRHRPPCGKSPPPPPSASAAMPPPPRPTGPVAAAATPGTVAPPQAAPRHGVGGSAARPLARPRATARQPGARPQGDGGARWEPGKEAIHGGLQLGPRAATQAGAHRRRCGCVLEAGARDDATRAVDLSPCT